MGLITDCELYFNKKNLYEVLSVDKNASATLLKKAFKKASLLCHPDKVDDSKKDEATRKFQTLAKVHYILSDAEKRAIYDETGLIDEENSFSVDDSSPDFWSGYFRTLFPKITKQQIGDFLENYKGSDEEEKDLIEWYNKYEGDFDKISESLIGYEADEEERICGLLKDLIKENRIPSYPKFVNEPEAKKNKRNKKAKKLKNEAAEAEEMDASESLLNALAKRSSERESSFNDMISSLEAKYGKKETGRKKKRVLMLNRKLKNEAAEAEEMDASESLLNALAKRSSERESSFNDMISSLEAKYGKKETGRKKKRV